MYTRNLACAALLMLAALALPALGQETPAIAGTLSNFDAWNIGDLPFNDLEIQLLGRVDPGCVRGWYPGWGAPPEIRPGTAFGPGITVVWRNARDPIRSGRSEHFGLGLDCEGEFTVRGFWSINGRPVAEIPLPWQFWEPRPGMVWDVIRMPRELEAGPVAVQRELVTLPEPVSLEELNWEKTEAIVRRAGREWQVFDRRPLPLKPGGKAVLEIPVTARDGAALVRYTVFRERQVVSRFVNQAVLSWRATPVCYPDLPAPEIEITGSVDSVNDGFAATNYSLEVVNRSEFPDALFAAAPDLPPCGLTTDASRTWAEIYSGGGAYQYGYCALDSSDDLDELWFTMPRGVPPPECVSLSLIDRRCEETYESACVPTAGYGPGCIDFETPPLGTTYHVGDVFVDSGATITVERFQWSTGAWTAGGSATIDDRGMAGGAGQEVVPNNVNLRFVFPVQPNALFLLFGEYGGNLNLEINGDFRNFEDFADIHGAVIGGVAVDVTHGFGDDQGSLRLSGEIHSFAVGGQELVIDHVCITETPPVDATGTWVLPYGIGGTMLYEIDADGLTNYLDEDSDFLMTGAPFGGRLGFRLESSSDIPTTDGEIYYYRFQYRHEDEPADSWHDFEETVRVHYVKEAPGAPPVFPTLVLGPHDIGGKNLYRFRPHQDELDDLVSLATGETVSWPKTGFHGDLYRGFLNTPALGLAAGRYLIRLEVYDSSGDRTSPEDGSFQFAVPTETLADGTIDTVFVEPEDIEDGGFEFSVHIDNRPTHAIIDEPRIGTEGAGDCGFLRYDPDDPDDPDDPPDTPPVQVAFHATHPENRALFTFRIVRGPTHLALAAVVGEEVSAIEAGTAGVYGAYTSLGHGNFSRSFTRGELLGDCIEAAFSENLHVYAKATRGWSHRITALDSHAVRAFALTPE